MFCFKLSLCQTDTSVVADTIKHKQKFKFEAFGGLEISRMPTYKVFKLKPYYDLSPFIIVQRKNTIYSYRYGIGTGTHSLGVGIKLSNR